MRKMRFAVLYVSFLVLAGCGALRPGFETPSVTVSSFNTVPSSGMMPAFEIGLRVMNPNPQALSLAGISYTIDLAGNELIKGVASELPTVPAYGEGEVKLTASANLLAGARLLRELMSADLNNVDYEIEAKLDLVGFGPSIRVRDSGNISLNPQR